MKRFLRAKEGMALTDGKHIADCVFLADGTAEGTWQEVTLAETERLRAAEETDFRQALQGFGVMI